MKREPQFSIPVHQNGSSYMAHFIKWDRAIYRPMVQESCLTPTLFCGANTL